MYIILIKIEIQIFTNVEICKSTFHCRRKNVGDYNFSGVNKDHHVARPVFNNCGKDDLLKHCT